MPGRPPALDKQQLTIIACTIQRISLLIHRRQGSNIKFLILLFLSSALIFICEDF